MSHHPHRPRMSYRRIVPSLLLSALLLLPEGGACAQGFAAITGRNHPEIDWRVAETPHFRIMYPAHLEGIEKDAGAIAEETYTALSSNLDVVFPNRIRIYLSDEDEINNGFASRLGDGWSNIWVHSGHAAGWTGPESWLRRVLSHEIAHIFHYRAVRSNIGLFDFLFANPLPRFWTEGLAQYQTERWDAYRGEMWLRTAVLEDKLSYRDGSSAWNGRLLYAVGNSQVRFLARSHGDSTLTRILHHRRPALFGLGRVHDFEDAFKSVTGESYRDFYDGWRRHVNIHYNTVAGQRQTIDSLDADRLDHPGQYLYDVRSLSGGRRLILFLESVDRPVRRLAIVDSTGHTHVLAEGTIREPVASTRDGRLVAFSRRERVENGSLIFDVHLLNTETGDHRRLTHGGRASSAALAPDGSRVAYVVNDRGISNIRILDLRTDRVTELTNNREDRQISHLAWHPGEDCIAYYVFDEHGQRRIEVIDVATSSITRITAGEHDDRAPVWSPDGTRIGFTSLRDGVPNIFVTDYDAPSDQRVTHLATGASLSDWVPSDDDSASGHMLAIVSRSKQNDLLYSLGANQRTGDREVHIDSSYVGWTSHAPPTRIPARISAAPGVVERRYAYSSWKNISHVASIGIPYFNSADDWGVGGGTLWIEPLGKHVLGAAVAFSIADPDKSLAWMTYINNEMRPSLAVTVSRLPDVARPYGDDILREDYSSVDLAALLPVDWRPHPYGSTHILLWARHYSVTPLNPADFADRADGLPIPSAGRQTSLRLSFKRKTLRPYRDSQTHPLDGWGIRSRITGAVLNEDVRQGYLRFEASAYGIVPIIERHRLYVHGRLRSQRGTSLPQDFVGLSRYDAIVIDAGGLLRWVSSEADRVRGHRRVAVGGHVLFGSLEYRIPLVPSLRTELLGLVSFGKTVLAPFFDAGYVWSRPNGRTAVAQYGAGVELKNTLKLFGLIELTHSVGFAQPASALFADDRYEVYYRIQSALPF